eukprot:TRINITY_DN26144_c0_g1_i1.p2 TRINITY_DN26144_c0_g1~~TRINITY_DN26144_c0_g1_i1.p2  ORF type:complete len:150 (+),score=2.23 TRINITY_DN26144_c0_g1_i1:94-543(+)
MAPKFQKTGDGTADFGIRYNPLTGSVHQVNIRPERGPYFLSDASAVPYSISQSLTSNEGVLKTLMSSAKSTSSYREWSQDRTRHIRSIQNPQEKYSQPLTSSLNIGWQNSQPKRPEHGKPKCHETKVAEAYILGAKNIDFTTNITRMHF